MLTCKKTYTDIPFAHRQHQHEGHCNLIHGHNWSLTLTFGCQETDACGFVVDFGDLKYLKGWIEEKLDHACVIAESDVEGRKLMESQPDLFKAYILPNASSEGLAKHLFEVFDPMVREHTNNRTYLIEIEVVEDSKNSALYRPELTV